MNVISKDLGYGIKSITLNDPKTCLLYTSDAADE